MRQIATTSKYRKDWELARRRNLPIEELNDIIFNWQTTFHYRLNRMAGAVTELSSLLLGMFKPSDCQEDTVIVDSMPIITCCGRSRTGKVARDIADKGYCSTKNLYYHGLKLHMVGYRRSSDYWERERRDKANEFYAPVKSVKGASEEEKQRCKAADDLYSHAVSSVREPIEALFSWLNEKTDIQRASKCRSTCGIRWVRLPSLFYTLFSTTDSNN